MGFNSGFKGLKGRGEGKGSVCTVCPNLWAYVACQQNRCTCCRHVHFFTIRITPNSSYKAGLQSSFRGRRRCI